MKTLIILLTTVGLWPSALALATQVRDSLAGTSVNWDSRIDGLANGASGKTVNNGGRGDNLIGWAANTNPANIDSMYGKWLNGWDISGVDNTYDIDSAFVYGYQDLALGNAPEVACYAVPSNWIEGTATGAYQFGSVSWNNRGHGTAINGVSVAQADSVWTAGERVGSRYLTTTNVTAQNTWYRWEVTTLVADSHAAGVNTVSFLLYDTSFVGGASHERCRIVSSEGASNKPYLIIYSSPPAVPAEPADVTLITLAGGTAGTLTNYPVRIRLPISGLLGWQAEQSGTFTILDSDTSTELYWCENFSTADTLDIFVRIPSTGNTDSIYFSASSPLASAGGLGGAYYHNCDSVFLYYQNFDGSFQFSQPVTTLETVHRASRDTLNNPFATKTIEGDSLYAQMREHSNICFYKGTGFWAASVNPVGTTYNTETNVQIALWTSTDTTHWTHQGRILIVQPGEDPLSGDTIQMEDPFLFEWQDSLYIAFEDKQEGTMADLVGLIVSADTGQTWQYRGVIIDSSIAIDYESPSSPVVWIENDTINVIYEGKLGSYEFGGVVYSLEAGAGFLARGTTPYNLIPVSNPDTVSGDTHSPILRLGANGTFNDYGMVPHTIRIEDGVHYAVCAASSGGALDDCAWFKSTAIVADWELVTAISDNDSIWITYGVANQDHDADYQLFPVSPPASAGGQGGVIYGIALSSNDLAYRTILQKHSSTGNPFDLQWRQTHVNGAKGFGFSGLGKSVLSIEAEPLSEKNALGIYTVTDSFDVNFMTDVRLKFTPGTYTTDPYFVASMGSGAVTNIAGGAGTSWEHSCMADGFGLQATGSAAWQPFVQPASAARSTSGFSTLADTYYQQQHFLHFGMSADTLRWGINYTIDQKKLNDSLDSDKKKIALFAGAHTSSMGHGARAEIDLLRVRKWHPFGPLQSIYPTVYIAPVTDGFKQPAFTIQPFSSRPFAQ